MSEGKVKSTPGQDSENRRTEERYAFDFTVLYRGSDQEKYQNASLINLSYHGALLSCRENSFAECNFGAGDSKGPMVLIKVLGLSLQLRCTIIRQVDGIVALQFCHTDNESLRILRDMIEPFERGSLMKVRSWQSKSATGTLWHSDGTELAIFAADTISHTELESKGIVTFRLAIPLRGVIFEVLWRADQDQLQLTSVVQDYATGFKESTHKDQTKCLREGLLILQGINNAEVRSRCLPFRETMLRQLSSMTTIRDRKAA